MDGGGSEMSASSTLKGYASEMVVAIRAAADCKEEKIAQLTMLKEFVSDVIADIERTHTV